MTLREFFDYLGEHPLLILAYFLIIPFTALLAGWLGKGEGHLSPWKYLYSLLVFGVCIPGIFSVALSVYQFLFDRGSIMNANVLLQILPILSMVFTLVVVRRNTPFESIPGFGKLSDLLTMIFVTFGLMYLLDRTRIFAFVNIPVHYLILIVLALLFLFRQAFKRILV